MFSVIAQRYRVGEKIAAASLGEIYKAYDVREFSSVAIWILPPRRAALVKAFFAECDNAARISSRFVHSLRDHGVDEKINRSYVVYELSEFQVVSSLGSVLRSKETIGKGQSFKILKSILVALSKFHGAKMFHGRLHPNNIFVVQNAVKLIGFGLKNIQRVNEIETVSQIYLSPEQREQKGETCLSDLYSVGIIFYEMLLGHDFLSEEGIVLSRLDAPLRQFLGRLLAPLPSNRFSSASEALEAMSRLLDS